MGKLILAVVVTMPVLGVHADKSGLGMQDSSKKIFPAFEYVEIPGTGDLQCVCS